MNRYAVGHAAIAVAGFLMGAVFAMALVPGSVLALLGMGIVFAFAARALFDQNFGDDWLWRWGKPSTRKPRKRPNVGRR